MGLALQRQADALNAGGGESDHHPKLHAHALALYTRGDMAPCILTVTLAPGESSTMFPCRLSSLHCAYRYLDVGRMLCVGCVESRERVFFCLGQRRRGSRETSR
jgi:hypothetical protein